MLSSLQSTFATALQAHFPEFVRCNQDELGDRRAVEDLARATLRNGGSVCIDRTNIDARQEFPSLMSVDTIVNVRPRSQPTSHLGTDRARKAGGFGLGFALRDPIRGTSAICTRE